ncbi:hypothetical protein [Pedobacter jejuensis]|uniref:Uncharacterized protein n=1 Tax=Pedobacter jejuensis TaxID=1268550 RepID=A0A3N0C1G5_9SPHI|nr:hypothetical protein [Pedobacter jejuensis]RNL55572.1 hypothetical protein D7004_04490 [Pedobacter jejuensis]
MLHQITWQQYTVVVVAFLLVWYAVVWLKYFKKPADGFLQPPEPLEHRDFEDDEPDDLLGRSAEEYGVSTVDSDELHFGPDAEEDLEPETSFADETVELQGLVPDVLEEIKTIIQTVESGDGTKEDFISLFKLVSTKYPQMAESRHLDAINDWIIENVPFELTEEELHQLWIS